MTEKLLHIECSSLCYFFKYFVHFYIFVLFVELCSTASTLASHSVCVSGPGTILMQCSGLKFTQSYNN